MHRILSTHQCLFGVAHEIGGFCLPSLSISSRDTFKGVKAKRATGCVIVAVHKNGAKAIKAVS